MFKTSFNLIICILTAVFLDSYTICQGQNNTSIVYFQKAVLKIVDAHGGSDSVVFGIGGIDTTGNRDPYQFICATNDLDSLFGEVDVSNIAPDSLDLRIIHKNSLMYNRTIRPDFQAPDYGFELFQTNLQLKRDIRPSLGGPCYGRSVIRYPYVEQPFNIGLLKAYHFPLMVYAKVSARYSGLSSAAFEIVKSDTLASVQLPFSNGTTSFMEDSSDFVLIDSIGTASELVNLQYHSVFYYIAGSTKAANLPQLSIARDNDALILANPCNVDYDYLISDLLGRVLFKGHVSSNSSEIITVQRQVLLIATTSSSQSTSCIKLY